MSAVHLRSQFGFLQSMLTSRDITRISFGLLLCTAAIGLTAVASSSSAALLRPPARYSSGVAFDSDRSVLVMFGGWAGSPLGDTWEWDGSTWRLAATTGPAARNAPALAYDSVRRKTVLFGGDSPGVTRGDTWEWDGAAWTQLAVSGPAPRTLHRLAFVPSRGRVVLFGGMSGPTRFGDVWEWTGTAWLQITTEGPARFLFGMAVEDSARLVVFGGNTRPASPPGNESGGTWKWTDGVWDSVPDSGPGRRDHVAIAHDALRQRTVLYGGLADSVLADLWEFDGGHWTNVSFQGGPGPRAFPQLVYDNVNHVVLLFGGFSDSGAKNDLWAWNGTTWRRVDDESSETLLRRFDIEPFVGGLRIRWELTGEVAAVGLERAPGDAGPWAEVARFETVAGARGEWVDSGAHVDQPSSYRLVVRYGDGSSSVAGTLRWPGTVRDAFALDQPIPNPAAIGISIEFGLARAERARLTLIDLQGRVVATLADGDYSAGRHRISWSASSAGPPSAGVYFVRLESASGARARRLTITR
ncbi:MAG: T9SS type A sorting domain-containing protein [Candidatus Eisenbacteria bacterium]|uniref:T9SS type A sorting domain-containing protein n=1 Tax=Eiseniibacteriota bacterium TaxID=2212470 RepID=A0A849SG96_UNCEI|nr:T9SS type A sorting domain-containing protein [Candidatus Eisenbacteria bacterium]